MVGKKIKKQIAQTQTSEKGYLVISLLFILILAGIITQGVIKLSTNQFIQLNELSRYYKNQTTLNLAENIFRQQIQESNQPIKSAQIMTSLGEVAIEKRSETTYELVLLDKTKQIIKKEVEVQSPAEMTEQETTTPIELENEQQDEKIESNEQIDEKLPDDTQDFQDLKTSEEKSLE